MTDSRPRPDAPVAVLGECVADAFVTPAADGAPAHTLHLEVHPGGGPANTAAALAALGTPTRFLARLADDVFGRAFRARMAASGADLTGCVTAGEAATLAVADLDDDGRADYSFHAEGTADWQWTAGELAAATDGPLSCLHTGSLALVREPGAAALEPLLEQIRPRATVSLDPNVRPLLVDPDRYRERLPHWCRSADLLRLSDEDLSHLLPGARPQEAARLLHGHGVPLVVVTLGGDGAFASLGGRPLRVRTPAVDVVDTVGAGDAFMAGFLHALHTAGALGGRLDGLGEATVAAALEAGVHAAARVCAVRGPNLPAPGPD